MTCPWWLVRAGTAGAAFLALILFAGCGGGNSTTGGNNGGGGGGGVVTAVAVSPRHAEVASTGALQQFTATVSGDSQNRVSWSVDGTAGGNAALGTIDASGLYTPPATAGTHSINAASTVDSTKTASSQVVVTDLSGVFTYHNNLARDGTNTQEFALTTANVKSTTFGKLFSCAVDGATYTQPLWVPGVNINGTLHNIILVATEHDSVYAFDADGSPCITLWQKSMLQTGEIPFQNSDFGGGFFDIQPEIGITGTPVIDPATKTVYLVAKSKVTASGAFHTRLHALSLIDGSEKFAGPTDITASLPGTGDGTNGTSVPFLSERENQRSALALVSGELYIVWGSHEDIDPYHGWLMKFDPATLQQLAVLNVTPNASRGGIWMGGAGPAADSDGNVYLSTGNGTFDADSSTPPNTDYGDTVLKLNSSLGITDFFTPFNQAALEAGDTDLASAGVVLLPDRANAPTHLMVALGKEGRIYLLDRDSLGGYCSICINNNTGDTNTVQNFVLDGNPFFGIPAFWQNAMYTGEISNAVKRVVFDPGTGQFDTNPASQTNNNFGFPGVTPSISSQDANHGIVWAIDSHDFGPPHQTGPGPAILHAYDAMDLSTELWNSTQAASNRDRAGNAVKFTVPTVANGKVYIGTRSEIDVYGLLP
jgi:hypothetical protein